MNVGGTTFNPGRLRTLVQLGKRTVSTETGGFQQPAYGNQAEVWAEWRGVHGAEVWAAAGQQAVDAATVTIRYHSEIDETWAISKDAGASWYEIVSIDDIENRHELMEIKVQKARAG